MEGGIVPPSAGYLRLLFDYSWWARDRILEAAAGLSDEDYAKPNGFTYKSLRGILTHALDAEALWLSRWLREPGAQVTEEDLRTVEALRARWAAVEARTRTFLASLSDEDLSREIVSRRRTGEPDSPPALVGSRPRHEPFDAAPQRSRRGSHDDRPLAG